MRVKPNKVSIEPHADGRPSENAVAARLRVGPVAAADPKTGVVSGGWNDCAPSDSGYSALPRPDIDGPWAALYPVVASGEIDDPSVAQAGGFLPSSGGRAGLPGPR